MSEKQPPLPGTITWTDLTVPDAARLRDFYEAVVGWETEGVDVGGYEDYSLKVPGTGHAVAGVCHARGINAALPPVWLIYITVADVDQALDRCTEMGGSLVHGPVDFGSGKFCVIRDPAGAVCALYQAGETA